VHGEVLGLQRVSLWGWGQHYGAASCWLCCGTTGHGMVLLSVLQSAWGEFGAPSAMCRFWCHKVAKAGLRHLHWWVLVPVGAALPREGRMNPGWECRG